MPRRAFALFALVLLAAPALAAAPALPDLGPGLAAAPSTLGDLAGALRGVRAGSDLPALAAAFADRAGGAAPSAEPLAVRVGITAGDLTGDGRADALVWSRDPASPAYAIEARGGVDGSVLWTRAFEGPSYLTVVPTTDLDGDGHEDAVVASFTTLSEREHTRCYVACATWYTHTYEWGYEALSGAQGDSLWSLSYPGSFRLTFIEVVLVATYTYDVENVFAQLIVPSPGAPARDLVINRYDVQERALYALANSTGEALDPATGQVVHSRIVREEPDVAYLGMHAEGYLDERARGVLLPGTCVVLVAADVCATSQGHDVTRRDASFAPQWSFAEGLAGASAAFDAGADLDGDGARDVFFLTGGARANEVWTLARSGSTGAPLWPEPLAGVPAVAGDLDGAGAADVVLVAPKDNSYYTRFRFTRVDGATGATLFETVPALRPSKAIVNTAWLGGDHDGDGARDVVTAGLSLAGGRYVSGLLIESARTGETLLDVAQDGIRGALLPGDLDADGKDDVLRIDLDFYAPEGFALGLDAWRMPDSASLWSSRDAFDRFPGIYAYSGADLLGGPGADVLLTTIVEGPAGLSSNVRALDGATGTVAWTA